MDKKKPLFKSPYDIKDVGVLFGIVALILLVSAFIGDHLFGLFQSSVNFG